MDKPATFWMIEPLRKYATFSGRARRQEYWWFFLFTLLVYIGLSIIDAVFVGAERVAEMGFGPLTAIATLAFLVPSIAVGIRRLHDRDKSGWWLLLGLVPLIGGIILLVWYVQRGTAGSNSYGPDPLIENVASVFD